MANRYQELLNEIPKGTFYPATGEILPTRSGPYEFRFETSTPNRQYGIFVDNVFRGVVVTNGSGVAVVNIELESGQHVVELVDSTTQEVASGILRLNGNVFWRGAFRAYITVRNYATWMAAQADVFDRVDTQIADMRNALSLSTVGQLYMGDVYGRGLRQPNDIGFLTDAYRFTLQELRQAYRLWGARPAGVREAVAALTDVSPLIVPRAWKPNWVLGGQLLPNGEVDASALVDDDSFPTLNARRFDFVRGSFPDNVTPVLPPYNNPPTPQPLTVTFDALWAGGNVVIEGFDESGNGISDTFVAAPGATVIGLIGEYFTETVAIRLTALGAGAGTATVGLAFSRFISLVEARGPLSPTGGATLHSVNHYSKIATPSLPFDALEIDGGIPVYVVQSGRYTIGGAFGVFSAGATTARLPGIAVAAPSGSTVNYGTRDRLSVRIDHLGVVRAPLPAAPDTLANVAAAVNAAIAREVSYGATRAAGGIAVLNNALLIEGDTITIVDGLTTIGVIEADSDNNVANGVNVPFAYAAPLTPAQTALAIRNAIRRSGIRTNAGVTTASPTVATLRSMLGGTSSNIPVVTTAAGAALFVSGMAAGADAVGIYLNRAAVVSNGVGDVLEIAASIGSSGPDACAEVVPWPIDGAPEVMGFPRERASLNASPVTGATTLPCADTSGLLQPPVIVLHPTLSSAVSPAPGPFTQPDWVTPVEVWFSADYDGGNVIVDGLDCDGGPLLETIEYPGPSVVDSGELGIDRFETGVRAANSVGTLAAVLVGSLDGPAAEIRVYNNLNPGTAGNGYSAQIAVGVGINLPLVVALAGVSLNITLGTDGAGAPDATKNTAALVKTAIEVYQLLAVFTGAGTGVISTVQPPTAFAGGVNDGKVVELTNAAGQPNVETWLPQVRPGMLFRLLSGAYAGRLRRIVYIGRETSSYPPASYEALAAEGYGGRVTKICLESSFGASFWNESWEIVEPVIVKGATPFKTISAMSSVTGANGSYQLRIADGVRDYGIPVRVGRGTTSGAAAGMCEPYDPIAGSQEVWPSARFLDGGRSPNPDDVGGILRIATPSLANYVNAGAHAIREIEPSQIGVAGGWTFLDHEDWELGAQFAKVGVPAVFPPGSYDWTTPVPETSLTWDVFQAGEVVMMVANDTAGNNVLIAEPGLVNAKTSGALVEPVRGMPVRREALETGLDQFIVDVDTALAPTALVTTENVTTQDRVIPDGWRAYNVDEANSLYCLWGRTQDLRLRLQHDGGAVLGGDMIIEIGVPNGADYKGQTLRISFWVEQMVSASENFQIDVSFDGGITWDAGALQAVGLSITDAGALGLGGENPTQVLRDIEVPTDTTAVAVRLRAVGFGAGDQIFLEKAIVTAVNSQGFFLGSGTVARGETQQQFGEMLYVWSPQDLNAAENVGLGLPDRPLIPLSIITRPGHESIVETPGHVDRIANAHGYWERVNISEYSPATATSGDPINVIGVHDAAEWLACVLTNMEVGVLSPARMSYVRPAEVSLVEGEELTIVGPGSSATLTETSQHEGLFPQHATSREQLYEDGVPVPSTGWPGTRASLAIGPSVGGDVIVTAIDPGKRPENITVEIDNGVGIDRPLHVTFDPGTDAILIELAARDGVLVADENRALMIASAVNDLGPVTAEAVIGNEAVVFAAALAATNLAGAQATPWRFTAANTVEIASTAAGDPVTDADYYQGVVPQDTGLLYYNPTSAYTIDYERLTRAESPVLDLGTTHADYLWLIDAAVYRRVEPAVIERSRAEPLIFYADYTARLSESSDQDQNTATLYSDTGIVREEVDLRNWSFKDATTIQISPSAFNPDAIYTLEYIAQLGQFPRIASFVLQHRSATTSPGVAAAAWRVVQIDEPVGRITDPAGGVIVHQYHQLRITISNVLDVRDVRVKSMGLKGIHLYGADAYAPGIISCDRE